MTSDARARMLQPIDNDAATARRLHILATEHWSLLATRGMTWNEIFSRTGTFLTVLSAAVVATSLVAQATGFGGGFRIFALVVLPVVLLLGLATFLRLVEADIEDTWLVTGMNRLRHAYLDLEPTLEKYFITSHHDDRVGILQTYSFRSHVGFSHLLSGSPLIVGTIDAVLTGVIAAIACFALNSGVPVQVAVGGLAGFAMASLLGYMGIRRIRGVNRRYRPLFPG
jgi:hypothetical protein